MSCTNRVGTSPHLGHPKHLPIKSKFFYIQSRAYFHVFRFVLFFFEMCHWILGSFSEGFFEVCAIFPRRLIRWLRPFSNAAWEAQNKMLFMWKIAKQKGQNPSIFLSKLTRLPKDQGWPNHCILQPLALEFTPHGMAALGDVQFCGIFVTQEALRYAVQTLRLGWVARRELWLRNTNNMRDIQIQNLVSSEVLWAVSV